MKKTLNAAKAVDESTVFVEFMLNIIKTAFIEYKRAEVIGLNIGTKEEKILLLLSNDPKLTANRPAEQLTLTKRVN